MLHDSHLKVQYNSFLRSKVLVLCLNMMSKPYQHQFLKFNTRYWTCCGDVRRESPFVSMDRKHVAGQITSSCIRSRIRHKNLLKHGHLVFSLFHDTRNQTSWMLATCCGNKILPSQQTFFSCKNGHVTHMRKTITSLQHPATCSLLCADHKQQNCLKENKHHNK